MRAVRSERWGYARIMAGTLLGGALGFYLMHRAELSYKRKWDEGLKKYEAEKLRREKAQQDNNQQALETSFTLISRDMLIFQQGFGSGSDN
ncbi:hypothetical protein V2J09_019419 [Rumex salicifolius]